MFAFSLKTDIGLHPVRFVPEADIFSLKQKEMR